MRAQPIKDHQSIPGYTLGSSEVENVEDPRTVLVPMLYFTVWGRKQG